MSSQSKNIFDAAARKLAQKKEKRGIPQPISQPTAKKPASIPSPGKHRDPEIREMLKKIDEMKLDLQNKLEYLHRKSGLTADQFRSYMENPKNFTTAEWEKLQQTKKEMGDKVWDAIGIELKPKTHRERENVAGERKAKTLGARKRWIPMK